MGTIRFWQTAGLLFLAFTFGACQKSDEIPPATSSGPITYLALGDSYTIGTSVSEQERYPVQLADTLRAEGYLVSDPVIIAKNGWTTTNLLNGIKDTPLSPPFELVSLLIGVNNQYQGRPISEYEDMFETLLDTAIFLAGNRLDRVFVLSIPDYAYTPFGQSTSNPSNISQQIDLFNAVNKAITLEKGVRYFDITPISRQGLDNPGLVATDNLHPSGTMYELWVAQILEDVKSMLE